jgi:hypothetical protein
VSSAPAQTAPPVYPDKIDGPVLKIAGVVVLGAIMSILDITVVNVALPTFQTEFGTPSAPLLYSTVTWTVTPTPWHWPWSSRSPAGRPTGSAPSAST